MLTLFPDETEVARSSDSSVVLTTHRISYEYKDFSSSYNQSIMLEHVTSCENIFRSSAFLLILAMATALLGLFAVVADEHSLFGVLVIVAIIAGILYGISRKTFVVISSPSTKMVIKVLGMSSDQVNGFINKVEQAKHTRLMMLRSETATK